MGLINAGDPTGAADDSYEVGKLYAAETYFSLRWAALYNAALAEACKPEATVESVLGVAREFVRYRAAAGALSGVSSLPREWIDQVNTATAADPYTNNYRTIEETAEGLHDAYLAKNRRLSALLNIMAKPE